MAETLDFEALWPFDLGRFGMTKGNAPCFLEVAWFLKTGELSKTMIFDEESEPLEELLQGVQDAMPDDKRQKLKQFIPRFIGCYDDTCERARREYILCQALWVWLPLALDAGGPEKNLRCSPICCVRHRGVFGSRAPRNG